MYINCFMPYQTILLYFLIKNTLPFDYHNDLEAARFVNSDITPEEMQHTAGIYVNNRTKI